tara:strand:+ start:97 stop:492 length:396 start_codon:yes stop_codon:yes gene_type:complete
MKQSKLELRIDDRGYLIVGSWKVHNIVWEQFNGKKPKGFQIDHINGNRLDNRIENLRIATYAENQWNAKKRIDNKSGIKGISWHKASKSWRAQIKQNKILYHLGLFKSLEDAKDMIENKRAELHGEFARNI